MSANPQLIDSTKGADGPNCQRRLVRRFVRMFGCDAARIETPGNRMFLLIGNKRHTRDDPGVWVDQDGNEKQWEYIDWKTIASGDTEAELIASAKKYKRLSKMTWVEYFRKEHGIHFPSNVKDSQEGSQESL